GERLLREERRLAYVALTRSKTHLPHTDSFRVPGQAGAYPPSIFLGETTRAGVVHLDLQPGPDDTKNPLVEDREPVTRHHPHPPPLGSGPGRRASALVLPRRGDSCRGGPPRPAARTGRGGVPARRRRRTGAVAPAAPAPGIRPRAHGAAHGTDRAHPPRGGDRRGDRSVVPAGPAAPGRTGRCVAGAPADGRGTPLGIARRRRRPRPRAVHAQPAPPAPLPTQRPRPQGYRVPRVGRATLQRPRPRRLAPAARGG